ncbi:MAG: polymer-forming cytoskeletal protein [Pseudomonadota bacterium]|nr:polymer-forming cytoskeletal protein [Pseudomonadota bacterium]
MNLLLFLICILILFALPLLPALLELEFPSDNEPLRIVQEYDTDIRHFATGFKSYLKKRFENFSFATFAEGTLEDGSSYQMVGQSSAPVLDTHEYIVGTTSRLILASEPLHLPEHVAFENEVYGGKTIRTGRGGRYRAVLAESDLQLAENTTVLRWMHSGATLRAEVNCRLFGRASADNTMHIAEGCRFERLNAPVIYFGNAEEMPLLPDATQLTPLKMPEHISFVYKNRWVVEDDLHVPPRSIFEGDLIATRDVFIGEGSIIKGGVKANRHLSLGAGVSIEGSVVATENLFIDRHCRIHGPIIAEDRIVIANGSVIGRQDRPTTVTAPVIEIAPEVTVFGSVWALDSALVAQPQGAIA